VLFILFYSPTQEVVNLRLCCRSWLCHNRSCFVTYKIYSLTSVRELDVFCWNNRSRIRKPVSEYRSLLLIIFRIFLVLRLLLRREIGLLLFLTTSRLLSLAGVNAVPASEYLMAKLLELPSGTLIFPPAQRGHADFETPFSGLTMKHITCFRLRATIF